MSSENEIKLFKYPISGWCGPGHLMMTLEFFNIDIPLEQIVKEVKTDEEGTDIAEIKQMLKRKGLVTQEWVNLTWEQFKHERSLTNDPIWVSWWYDLSCHDDPDGHYSLVKSVGDDTIELYDGFTGKVLLLPKELWMSLWKDSADPLEDGSDFRWAMRVSKQPSFAQKLWL